MRIRLLHLSATRLLALGLLASLFIVSTVLGPAVQAQSSSTDTAPPRRLKIYPLRTEINVKAGTAYKGSFTLENTGTEPLNVELSAESFDVVDSTYDYLFDPASEISTWVHFSTSSIQLQPKMKYPVQYIINVPVGTEPGGAYLSLFGASTPNPDSSIESVDRVGSLVYITIPGDITKTGSLLSFSSPYIGAGGTPWSASIRNSGTAHFTTDYSIALKTLWGSEVSAQESSSLILPRSIRLLQGTVPEPSWLGLYVTHYSIPLGDNGTATGTRPYVYLPPSQTIALVALVLAVILFTRIVRSNKHKKGSSAAARKHRNTEED